MNLKNYVWIDYKKNISAIYDRTINLTKSKKLFENKWKQMLIKIDKNYNKKKSTFRLIKKIEYISMQKIFASFDFQKNWIINFTIFISSSN